MLYRADLSGCRNSFLFYVFLLPVDPVVINLSPNLFLRAVSFRFRQTWTQRYFALIRSRWSICTDGPLFSRFLNLTVHRRMLMLYDTFIWIFRSGPRNFEASTTPLQRHRLRRRARETLIGAERFSVKLYCWISCRLKRTLHRINKLSPRFFSITSFPADKSILHSVITWLVGSSN